MNSSTTTTRLRAALLSKSFSRPNPEILSSFFSSSLSFVDKMFLASSNCTMMTIKTQRMMPAAAKSSSEILNSRRAYCSLLKNRRFRSDLVRKSSESRTSTISAAAVEVNDVSSSPSTSSHVEDDAAAKIGAQIRVKVPLKVYHIPRVPEIDLTGMEGEIKQYVGLWKGKTISANLPYKVEFATEVQGRGPVKFFAHLKEDEFEYI